MHVDACLYVIICSFKITCTLAKSEQCVCRCGRWALTAGCMGWVMRQVMMKGGMRGAYAVTQTATLTGALRGTHAQTDPQTDPQTHAVARTATLTAHRGTHAQLSLPKTVLAHPPPAALRVQFWQVCAAHGISYTSMVTPGMGLMVLAACTLGMQPW